MVDSSKGKNLTDIPKKHQDILDGLKVLFRINHQVSSIGYDGIEKDLPEYKVQKRSGYYLITKL